MRAIEKEEMSQLSSLHLQVERSLNLRQFLFTLYFSLHLTFHLNETVIHFCLIKTYKNHLQFIGWMKIISSKNEWMVSSVRGFCRFIKWKSRNFFFATIEFANFADLLVRPLTTNWFKNDGDEWAQWVELFFFKINVQVRLHSNMESSFFF